MFSFGDLEIRVHTRSASRVSNGVRSKFLASQVKATSLIWTHFKLAPPSQHHNRDIFLVNSSTVARSHPNNLLNFACSAPWAKNLSWGWSALNRFEVGTTTLKIELRESGFFIHSCSKLFKPTKFHWYFKPLFEERLNGTWFSEENEKVAVIKCRLDFLIGSLTQFHRGFFSHRSTIFST